MRDNGHVTEAVSLLEGMVIERLFYGGEYGHVTEVVSLMEGEWSCYGGGQFNGGRMIMLEGWSVLWRENGHFTEVEILMEG